MEETNFRLLVMIVSAALYFIILLGMPVRVRFILKKAGKKILSFKTGTILFQILIIIFSALIIALLFFRELGYLGDVILALVSLLGVLMGSEEAFLAKFSGVYENGIIGNGRFIPRSEIYSIPVLNLPEEERPTSSLSLKIITNKKGTVTFTYSSPEEKEAAMAEIIKLCPSLQK